MPLTSHDVPIPQVSLQEYETRFADRHLLHGAIETWASRRGGHPALVEFNTGRRLTYRQLHDQTTAIAVELVDVGFRPGDFLATSLPLLAEHVLLEYACFKIGVIHAPLDLRIKTPEILRLLHLIQPRGYVFGPTTSAVNAVDIGRVVHAQGPPLEFLIQFDPPPITIPGAITAEAFFSRAEKRAQAIATHAAAVPAWKRYQEIHRAITPSDGAQVIFTTGSTGLPKPALLSHRNITCQNLCLTHGFQFTEATRMLVNLPPSHVGCQGEELMSTLFAGGTAVLLHVFDPEMSLRAIQDLQINCFGQIPSMFNMQWRLPNFPEFDLSSLDKVLFGGQQVTHQFLNRLTQMCPRVGTGLGLTEMAGFVTYTGITENPNELIDNVGWPMPVTPLSIREPMRPDGTAGDRLPDGKTGEICFSGPQVFIGYVNNDDAYRHTVTRDSVCYTGDLGSIGPRGLIFKGRSKLVIKPKGYQVHPAEIENHFAALRKDVAACGAVGAEHDVFGEAVVLFLERHTGSALHNDDLLRHAKGIASYMRPLHYVILPEGGLPLNRVNKTDYVRLRDMAAEEVIRLRELGEWDRS